MNEETNLNQSHFFTCAMESFGIHRENVKHGREVILYMHPFVSPSAFLDMVFSSRYLASQLLKGVELFWVQGFGRFSKGLEYQIMWCI